MIQKEGPKEIIGVSHTVGSYQNTIQYILSKYGRDVKILLELHPEQLGDSWFSYLAKEFPNHIKGDMGRYRNIKQMNKENERTLQYRAFNKKVEDLLVQAKESSIESLIDEMRPLTKFYFKEKAIKLYNMLSLSHRQNFAFRNKGLKEETYKENPEIIVVGAIHGLSLKKEFRESQLTFLCHDDSHIPSVFFHKPALLILTLLYCLFNGTFFEIQLEFFENFESNYEEVD